MPCDSVFDLVIDFGPLEVIFQFPFHRDMPCDATADGVQAYKVIALSVPFSSGYAL